MDRTSSTQNENLQSAYHFYNSRYVFWIISYPIRLFFSSSWPSDSMWRHGYLSTWVWVQAYCLRAKDYYLIQCWLIISACRILRLQRKPLVSDPFMHYGTCVTHVSWCMSGSLNRCGGENVPGIPGATRNFTYLIRGPFNLKCTWG